MGLTAPHGCIFGTGDGFGTNALHDIDGWQQNTVAVQGISQGMGQHNVLVGLQGQLVQAVDCGRIVAQRGECSQSLDSLQIDKMLTASLFALPIVGPGFDRHFDLAGHHAQQRRRGHRINGSKMPG